MRRHSSGDAPEAAADACGAQRGRQLRHRLHYERQVLRESRMGVRLPGK